PHFLNWTRDAFENHVARVDFPDPVGRLAIEVDVVAEIPDVDPFDFLLAPDAVSYPLAYELQLARELAPYLDGGEPGPRLRRWLARMPRDPAGAVMRVRDVLLAVHRDVALGATSPARALDVEATLASGRGGPAALAWLLVLSLRALGLAARYASGY